MDSLCVNVRTPKSLTTLLFFWGRTLFLCLYVCTELYKCGMCIVGLSVDSFIQQQLSSLSDSLAAASSFLVFLFRCALPVIFASRPCTLVRHRHEESVLSSLGVKREAVHFSYAACHTTLFGRFWAFHFVEEENVDMFGIYKYSCSYGAMFFVASFVDKYAYIFVCGCFYGAAEDIEHRDWITGYYSFMDERLTLHFFSELEWGIMWRMQANMEFHVDDIVMTVLILNFEKK